VETKVELQSTSEVNKRKIQSKHLSELKERKEWNETLEDFSSLCKIVIALS